MARATWQPWGENRCNGSAVRFNHHTCRRFWLALGRSEAYGSDPASRFCELPLKVRAMDETESTLLPSAAGILNCLRALAREAASLHLFRTLSAIEDALEAATRESGMDAFEDPTREAAERPVLH